MSEAELEPIDDHEQTGGSATDKAAREVVDLLLKVVRDGAGPLVGSQGYAELRLEQADGDVDVAVRRVIRETASYSGGLGFLTGLGGFVAMPVTFPTNLAGTMILNTRMVGAIAHLHGWDLEDERVQALLLLVVAGTPAQKAMKAVGIKVGQELTKVAIKKIPIALIREINKRAGFMLLAKYGTKRATLTLVKAVPVIGGIAGGSIDAGIAVAIGNAAAKAFPDVHDEPEPTAEVGNAGRVNNGAQHEELAESNLSGPSA